MKATNKMRAATAGLLHAAHSSFQAALSVRNTIAPSVDTPGTFKEVTPDDLKKMDGWKVAQPQDSALHGKWWEIFGDPQLNALEEQVSISNQNVASAFANFMAARAIVREARAQYFPTLTVGPSATRQRTVGCDDQWQHHRDDLQRILSTL
jgi:outer membrane protein TolC